MVRQVPAMAAIASRHSAHVPWRLIWSATMRNAASSLTVNCAAWCGGTGQHAARRRRRSIERCLSGERCRRGGAVKEPLPSIPARCNGLVALATLSACYKIWKARGRPARRRTSFWVDVLAPRRYPCIGGGWRWSWHESRTGKLRVSLSSF